MRYAYENGGNVEIITASRAAQIAGINPPFEPFDLEALKQAGVFPVSEARPAPSAPDKKVVFDDTLQKDGQVYRFGTKEITIPTTRYPTLDRWQLYWILEDIGEKAAVDAFIDGLPDAADKVKYSDKSTFKRTDPIINLIVSQVSLNPPQFNAKWLEAAALD